MVSPPLKKRVFEQVLFINQELPKAIQEPLFATPIKVKIEHCRHIHPIKIFKPYIDLLNHINLEPRLFTNI